MFPGFGLGACPTWDHGLGRQGPGNVTCRTYIGLCLHFNPSAHLKIFIFKGPYFSSVGSLTYFEKKKVPGKKGKKMANNFISWLKLYKMCVPLMKLVDFRHVAKQHVLLAQQVAGDEVSHGRVVHLRCVALDIFFF